uniref:Uncharacterized protein n=1 Tax=Noctiluca scintillans TaxID=2966 RepID=A0A7S0ZPM5_NOCSC|mmetsp:Transcript_1372/g.3684  ORF Transcript_1372/g.3684 Transcript_1372/m.3684 type:complete len:110 (+) Transcript_1372:154-483(+)
MERAIVCPASVGCSVQILETLLEHGARIVASGSVKRGSTYRFLRNLVSTDLIAALSSGWATAVLLVPGGRWPRVSALMGMRQADPVLQSRRHFTSVFSRASFAMSGFLW